MGFKKDSSDFPFKRNLTYFSLCCSLTSIVSYSKYIIYGIFSPFLLIFVDTSNGKEYRRNHSTFVVEL